MLNRKQVVVGVLVVMAAVVAIVIRTSCYYSRGNPESLRSELISAGIMGRTPADAASVLGRLQIPRGSDLTIGEFNPTTRLLYASVSNAERRGWHVWRARVTLSFDASDRVADVAVDLTADRPL